MAAAWLHERQTSFPVEPGRQRHAGHGLLVGVAFLDPHMLAPRPASTRAAKERWRRGRACWDAFAQPARSH
eukprot:11201718-Lingulodinium_polyedra.AAC.1